MGIDRGRAAAQLKAFDFASLFNELGWDRPRFRQPEILLLAGETYVLSSVAEKRGVRIFHCCTIPDRAARQRIEREVTKLAYEHLIIFTDAELTRQVWQWVSREKGKPAAFREHVWLVAKAPDSLIQKLDHIAFSLDEEEGLTLAGTTLRLRDAFDRERITKRFYGEFEVQHQAFLGFIQGLEQNTDRQWYASLMLNRLMFIYFIQKKGFLDNDPNYLRERLKRVRQERGGGQFHSFYRLFLRTLFHEGFAAPLEERDESTRKLLGSIPYLNGGLFEPHALEAAGNDIEIADEAFDSVFAFFDRYDWTLDTRPIARNDGREINPDVLGHIFEKYINNKQMGAYYTKEDITDYITKNTVVPWLFKNAVEHDRVAFEPAGAVWRMLSENPDAYIHPSMKRGADIPLPENIAAGIDDVARRLDWNKVASREHGLPTEIWREVIARRERYEMVKARAAEGKITSIEDFVTYNLDIRQFARDAIQYAESPDLVRAFWKGIRGITVIDPACGSGAFLFAALSILHDLYDACLERMEEFVATAPADDGPRQLYSDFREILDQVARHPNRDYFIYKSIIIANLYGVDIMDEAVEICKLRLFLKLAAQIERADQIEPLPDIDFNIRSGNTLIGYTSIDEIRAPKVAALEFNNDVEEIERSAQSLDIAFRLFRQQQTDLHGAVDADVKAELRSHLVSLERRLDEYLARDYGVKSGIDAVDPDALRQWRTSHKPFHWIIEFYGIMRDGGFHAIVGNPPYLEYSKVRDDYKVRNLETLPCGNLYGFFAERSESIRHSQGLVALIVPLSMMATPNMSSVMTMLDSSYRSIWISYFSNRPDQLFEGAQNFLAIYIASDGDYAPQKCTTGLRRWPGQLRDTLFETMAYVPVDRSRAYPDYAFPKFQSPLDQPIWNKLSVQSERLLHFASHQLATGKAALYCYGGIYWTKARNFDSFVIRNGVEAVSTADRPFRMRDGVEPEAVVAVLNSSLHFWFWVNFSDCRNKTYNVMFDMPMSTKIVTDPAISFLGSKLMLGYRENAQQKIRDGRNRTVFTEYYPRKSKDVIDEIDRKIGHHLGLSAEEIDYIINYDVRFRMGADDEEAD